MAISKKYRCTKCKGEYSTEDIRLSADGQVTCVYCMGKKQRGVTEPVKAEKSQEEQTAYMCGNCKYQFKRKKSLVIKVCPYCGKEGKVFLKANISAEHILNDSGED
ncbi:MAG: hypothetical protein ABIJ34_01535 [archaeon]